MNLQLGTPLIVEGRAHLVVAIGAGEVILRREADGKRVQILTAELARSAQEAPEATAHNPLDADLQILSQLRPAEQAEIRWWVGFLADLNDRVQVATNAGRPLAPVLQESLRRAATAGHPVSLRTLYNKRERVSRAGAAGLIAGRGRRLGRDTRRSSRPCVRCS